MIPNIHKGLLQFVFSGSYMKRWNDKLRCFELIETDKQAHKMIVAWLLCQLQAPDLSFADRQSLEQEVVEGGIFDYLFRLVITDIKPPILYRIKENPEHYASLAHWALAELEPQVRPLGRDFWRRFRAYVEEPHPKGRAADILGAAHLYASVWEFRLIQQLNDPFDEEMADIDAKFRHQLEGYAHLTGMPELLQGLVTRDARPGPEQHALPNVQPPPSRRETTQEPGRPPSALCRFANLCGQLRFQKRWSQTPRTPETSVMGHMFLVACYAYFLSMALEACPARRVNNFFCGLLHDLPEMLTRDIISPVKKSSDALSTIIKAYEEDELERRVFAPLRQAGHHHVISRLGYYLGLETGSEFHNTIISSGRSLALEFDDFHRLHNRNELDPKDGETIKICDTLAAYIEAYTAIRNGITSEQIQQAFWRMREQHAKRVLAHLPIGPLFTDFD